MKLDQIIFNFLMKKYDVIEYAILPIVRDKAATLIPRYCIKNKPEISIIKIEIMFRNTA